MPNHRIGSVIVTFSLGACSPRRLVVPAFCGFSTLPDFSSSDARAESLKSLDSSSALSSVAVISLLDSQYKSSQHLW